MLLGLLSKGRTATAAAATLAASSASDRHKNTPFFTRIVFADGARSPESVPQFATNPASKARRRELLSGASPIVQMLIGNAMGDAFGYGIEMQDAYWIRTDVPMPPIEKKWPLLYQGAWWDDKMHGQYSDDCEMTVGLMNGFVKKGRGIDAEGMLTAWKQEWDLSSTRPSPADAGLPTAEGVKRGGHGSIVRYWTGKATIDEIRASQAKKVDPGNAPPMRSLPLAFIPDKERDCLCVAAADATHPHPKARAASFLVATGGRWLMVDKGDRFQIIKVALESLQRSSIACPETVAHLEGLEALPDWHTYGPRFQSMPRDVHTYLCGPQPFRSDIIGPGKPPSHRCGLDSDAMRTVGCVLYILKWHRGPMDGLTAAIDIGGDVDSSAALVLGAIGGSEGLALGSSGGIPWWMVEEVEGVEYLVARAQAFEQWLVSESLWQSS